MQLSAVHPQSMLEQAAVVRCEEIYSENWDKWPRSAIVSFQRALRMIKSKDPPATSPSDLDLWKAAVAESKYGKANTIDLDWGVWIVLRSMCYDNPHANALCRQRFINGQCTQKIKTRYHLDKDILTIDHLHTSSEEYGKRPVNWPPLLNSTAGSQAVPNPSERSLAAPKSIEESLVIRNSTGTKRAVQTAEDDIPRKRQRAAHSHKVLNDYQKPWETDGDDDYFPPEKKGKGKVVAGSLAAPRVNPEHVIASVPMASRSPSQEFYDANADLSPRAQKRLVTSEDREDCEDPNPTVKPLPQSTPAAQQFEQPGSLAFVTRSNAILEDMFNLCREVSSRTSSNPHLVFAVTGSIHASMS